MSLSSIYIPYPAHSRSHSHSHSYTTSQSHSTGKAMKLHSDPIISDDQQIDPTFLSFEEEKERCFDENNNDSKDVPDSLLTYSAEDCTAFDASENDSLETESSDELIILPETQPHTSSEDTTTSIRYDPNNSAGVDEDSFFMNLAINESHRCIPSLNAYSVGAVLVSASRHLVISTGYSRELEGNTHAEECALIKYKSMWEDWAKKTREKRRVAKSVPVKASNDEQEDHITTTAFSFSSSSNCSSCVSSSFSDVTASALSSCPSSPCSSPPPHILPKSSSSSSNSSSSISSSSSNILDSLSDILPLSSPFPLPDDFVMYSTMEPCSERLSGKRSCSCRLLDGSIHRVVIGALEPVFFVKCEGIDLLRSHGVRVDIMEPKSEWQKKCLSMNQHIYDQKMKEKSEEQKKNETTENEKTA